jgi:hypothetical protein
MGLPLIIVPYRDSGDGVRQEHLRLFKAHMHTHNCKNFILVVEQSKDLKKFNRGALLNIGAVLATNADSFIFHDVDLLPNAQVLESYVDPGPDPVHFGALWTSKYTHKTFCGGVLYMTRKHLERINGYPNKCWGWGGEDDVVRNRLLSLDLPIKSPPLHAGLSYVELSHEHQGHNPLLKNMSRWEDIEEYSNDLSSGLSNVRFTYTVVSDGHIKVSIL